MTTEPDPNEHHYRLPGKVAQAVEMVNAKVTGGEPDLGSSGTLQV